MSLINEALKKARREAARQDAARRGLPLPVAHQSAGPRLVPPLLMGTGLVAAALLIGALVFLAGRRSSSVRTDPDAAIDVSSPATPVASREPAVPPLAPVDPAAVTAVRTAPAPPIEDAVAEGTEATTGATPGQLAPASPESRPARGSGTLERIEPPPTPTISEAIEPAPLGQERAPEAGGVASGSQAGSAEAEAPIIAVRLLELPNSRRIELGGIAWSAESPFALINSRVVGIGDSVQSLTVVAIEQRHVELAGDEGRFILRLK